MTARYGCWGRATFSPYYLPTGAPDEAQYRIPHVFTRECQYRHTALGQADAKCDGCVWRQDDTKAHQDGATPGIRFFGGHPTEGNSNHVNSLVGETSNGWTVDSAQWTEVDT